MKGRFVIFIIIAVLIGVFALQNTSFVKFRVLFWDVTMAPSMLVIIALFVGILLLAVLLLPVLQKRKKVIRNLEKEVEKLQASITNDDNHPLGPKMGDDNFKSFFS